MSALAAILGAGFSRRFAGDKLGAELGGRPLGQWALEAVSALNTDVAWIGREAAPPFLAGYPRCCFVANADAAEGMATSVRLAAALAQAGQFDRLLLVLADMPDIPTAHLERLLAAPLPSATAYPGERPGVPAALPAALFGELSALRGDQGAGALLARLPAVTLVPLAPELLIDIDTPQALQDRARTG